MTKSFFLFLQYVPLYMILLTSLAITAAEPLVEILLILHTCSVPSDGEVFVFIAGPLRCWKFCCLTHQPDEECCHQYLNHLSRGRQSTKEKKSFALFLYIHSIQIHPLKLIRWRTVKRISYLHRKPCVSNLWLNLNHLIWTSAVGKQLKEPSSRSELEAKQPCVCRMQSYTLTACSATGKQI